MARPRTAKAPELKPAIAMEQVMHDLKYVPAIRFRQEEHKAIESVDLSAKVLPLLEIVMEVPRAKKNAEFGRDYTAELAALRRPLIVDLPTYEKIGASLKNEVQDFLRRVQASVQQRVDYYAKLSSVTNLIPTVSYTTQAPYVPGTIKRMVTALRPTFPRLAFRVFDHAFPAAMKEVIQYATDGDIVILDIDEDAHGNPALTTQYSQVNALKTKGCKTVILQSAIPDGLPNNKLPEDQPVLKIDNSLRTAYRGYGFDAFGDFAGIKKDLPKKGGTVSPGFIFYSWKGNLSVGYKGRAADLAEFKAYIGPMVLASRYYRQYGSTHQSQCPGCMLVDRIVNGPDSGKSQGQWKRIAMMHYLYTMEEYL